MKLTIPSITIDPASWGKPERAEAEGALREIHGNLTLTDSKVEAWFRIAPLAFDWKSATQQNELLRQAALAWTGLRGRDFHLRITHRPYPAAKWAMAYSAANPHPANPGHFRRHLLDVQQAMRGSTLADTEVYIGVTVGGRNLVNRLGAHVTKGTSIEKETIKLADTIATLAAALQRPGLTATPATDDELSWLLHRSVGLHLPEPIDLDCAPSTVEEWDASVFWDNVDIDPAPGKPYTTLTGLAPRNGADVTRHVAVLSLGRCGAIEVPERHDPWLAILEKLSVPVEVSVRGTVLGGKAAAKHMKGRLKAIADQKEQFDNQNVPYTPELQRVDARANALADEMENAPDADGARMHGHVRFAVAGRDGEEVRANVRAIQALYDDMKFEVAWDGKGQVALAREFIPGEKVQIASHKRHFPIPYWTAGVPHLSATVGDRDGIPWGYTVGTTKRAVTWDPWRAMIEEEQSGVTPVFGTPGAGKSTLMAHFASMAADASIPTTVVDYKGPLAKLVGQRRYLPGQALHIDALTSAEGRLSIYSSITAPTREQLLDHPRIYKAWATDATDDEVQDLLTDLHREGEETAALQRMEDAKSILLQLLPHSSRIETGVDRVVGAAVDHIGGSRKASLDEVVAYMVGSRNHDDRLMRSVGQELAIIAKHRHARLFFGQGNLDDDITKPVLVVITAPGLVLPDSDDERTWRPEHRLAIPLRAAVLNYAGRRMASYRLNQRKLFVADEAHEDRRFPAQRAFYDRGFRKSRYGRERWLFGTQKAEDLQQMQGEGLVSEVITGWIKDEEDAKQALRFHGAPEMYATTIMGLREDKKAPYRDFFFTDSRGNHDVVRADLRHEKELLDATADRREGIEERERLVLAKAGAA